MPYVLTRRRFHPSVRRPTSVDNHFLYDLEIFPLTGAESWALGRAALERTLISCATKYLLIVGARASWNEYAPTHRLPALADDVFVDFLSIEARDHRFALPTEGVIVILSAARFALQTKRVLERWVTNKPSKRAVIFCDS